MTKGKPIVILIPPDLRAAYEPIAAAEHRSMRNKVIDVFRRGSKNATPRADVPPGLRCRARNSVPRKRTAAGVADPTAIQITRALSLASIALAELKALRNATKGQ